MAQEAERLRDALELVAHTTSTHRAEIVAGLILQGFAEEAEELEQALDRWTQAGDAFLRSVGPTVGEREPHQGSRKAGL